MQVGIFILRLLCNIARLSLFLNSKGGQTLLLLKF